MRYIWFFSYNIQNRTELHLAKLLGYFISLAINNFLVEMCEIFCSLHRFCSL